MVVRNTSPLTQQQPREHQRRFQERVCLILAGLYTDTVKRVWEKLDGMSTIHILPLPSSG